MDNREGDRESQGEGVQARLITLEGIDGVGKTTHVMHLVEYLTRLGLPVTTFREPGDTPLGERLRGLLKEGLAESAMAELLLFTAARAELTASRIRPTLAAGTNVVLDRYNDSTIAYQGALGTINEADLRAVCHAATGGLAPDLTLWLDLEPESAFSRRYPLAQALDAGGTSSGNNAAAELDAIEQRSIGYFTHVRERYAAIQSAEPERVLRIDASGSIDQTRALVRAAVEQRLAEWQEE